MNLVQELFFSVRDVQYIYQQTGYTIVATTDVPCHLWLRYSTVKPKKRKAPRFRRGIYIHTDVYLCFVAYHDNEQEEGGDTYIHTFHKKNWPHCETRYFHFWGTIGGNTCHSTTAAFEKHFTEPSYFILQVTGDGDETNIRNWVPFTPPTHWDKVLHQDTIFDPDYGLWGWFTGQYVYEQWYYNDNYHRDLYTLQAPPPTYKSILKVEFRAWCCRTTYPYGKMKHVFKTHGTVYESDEQWLFPWFEWRTREYEKNPFTEWAWTLPEIQDLQAGIALGKEASFGTALCDYFEVKVYLRPLKA